eukprot:g75451.t1
MLQFTRNSSWAAWWCTRYIVVEVRASTHLSRVALALLWLKVFLDRSNISICHNHCTNTYLLAARGTLFHEKLFWFREEGKDPPTPAILLRETKSDTIEIIHQRGGVTEQSMFRVAAIEAIHCGRHSAAFGMMKLVFSLRFKGSNYRSLHFAVPHRDCLNELTESLCRLAKIESCECLSIAIASAANTRKNAVVKKNIIASI